MKKNNDFLKDLHIGRIIKEIALQKGISSKKIADIINRDHHNADKIFKMNDMDTEDIIRISYLLKYNILELIAKNYLSHLTSTNHSTGSEFSLLKIDIGNQAITIYDEFNNSDFLKNIHIGQHIRMIAKKNELSGRDMANKLHCSQGMISHLYKSKSLKVKTLMQISNALQYHFIAEIYLSQIITASFWDMLDNCIITFNPHQIQILNANDKTIVMVFQRNDDKK
jgi:transcriptional regulator with XRE-family HTH domain